MRQGSIISPWVFNCFYRDMVKTINDMECGLILGNNRYNVICYADDLLLTIECHKDWPSDTDQLMPEVCRGTWLVLQPIQDQLHSDRKIAIHHRSNFLHIGCEIAECKDLQIPAGGARQSVALRACETANPSNKRCLS